MNYHGVVRIGTNLPDKRVFMNLRRKVSLIQGRNGGMPITDADRAKIAGELKVKVETIKRMEPRIFSTDTVIVTTDVATDDDGERMSMRDGVIAVQGEQPIVEREMDQRQIMGRICAIVEENFDERDLEIVEARLAGDMTQEKFEYLRGKYEISVERIRQIQRGALLTIREALQREGISGIDQIAC
jgi:DNA-directed RNA polymerase sigma subunit (sigma70/sigma32)